MDLLLANEDDFVLSDGSSDEAESSANSDDFQLMIWLMLLEVKKVVVACLKQNLELLKRGE